MNLFPLSKSTGNTIQASSLPSDFLETDCTSFSHACFVSMGLLYLAIPNLLMLWGWYTAPIAVIASLLLLFFIGKIIYHQFKCTHFKTSHKGCFFFSVSLISLILAYWIAKNGLIAYWPPYNDFYIFREALFSNLRDAAWPLILPNGKEMSYYLADILPCAAMARCLPTAYSSPLLIVWILLAFLLSYLIMSTRDMCRGCLGKRLLCFFFCSFCLFIPFHQIFFLLKNHEISIILSHINLLECTVQSGIEQYNSVTPALLSTSLIFSARCCRLTLITTVLALTGLISPLSCIGILPLAAVAFYKELKVTQTYQIKIIISDFLLPCVMLFLAAVYYLRADGINIVSLDFAVNGSTAVIKYIIRSFGLLLLIVPLWKHAKKELFFIPCVICMFVIRLFFIGSPPSAGFPGINELWLKIHAIYTFILAWYWVKYWKQIALAKYFVLGIGVFFTIIDMIAGVYLFEATPTPFNIKDKWDGHLNHDDPFFIQSVPRCKEPFIQGIMLRSGGESEKHFPGCLIPKAPGCDYSRRPKHQE